MALIELTTIINAKPELVFDLSRSIDLHTVSASQTKEKAIAGKTTGLIGLNETVTWRAKHFGIYQTLTTKITSYNRPFSFTDEMVSGAFKSFKHEHLFTELNGATEMTDRFEFKTPLGIIGRFVEKLVLKNYMRRFLQTRNEIVKQVAESGDWKHIIPTGNKS